MRYAASTAAARSMHEHVLPAAALLCDAPLLCGHARAYTLALPLLLCDAAGAAGSPR